MWGATTGIRRAAALGLALGLAACSGLQVRSDFDAEVDFSRYRTFAWLAPPQRASAEPAAAGRDPFTHNSLLDKRVRAAVEQELAARGYQRADGGEPDFRLDYHVMLEERLRAQATDFGGHLFHHHHHGFGAGIDVDVQEYPEGTLVLDVIDPGRDQLVWRGWAVGRNRDGHYDAEEVRRAVHHILRRFPPTG